MFYARSAAGYRLFYPNLVFLANSQYLTLRNCVQVPTDLPNHQQEDSPPHEQQHDPEIKASKQVTCYITSAATPHALQKVINDNQEKLNFINLAAAWRQVKQLEQKTCFLFDHDFLHALQWKTQQQLRMFNPTEILSVLKIMFEIGYTPSFQDDLWEKILQSLELFKEQLSPHQIPLIVYYMIQNGYKEGEGKLFEQIKEAMQDGIQEMTAEELGMMAYGMAKLRWVNQELWESIINQFVQKQDQSNVTDITRIAWASRLLNLQLPDNFGEIINSHVLDVTLEQACIFSLALDSKHRNAQFVLAMNQRFSRYQISNFHQLFAEFDISVESMDMLSQLLIQQYQGSWNVPINQVLADSENTAVRDQIQEFEKQTFAERISSQQQGVEIPTTFKQNESRFRSLVAVQKELNPKSDQLDIYKTLDVLTSQGAQMGLEQLLPYLYSVPTQWRTLLHNIGDDDKNIVRQVANQLAKHFSMMAPYLSNKDLQDVVMGIARLDSEIRMQYTGAFALQLVNRMDNFDLRFVIQLQYVLGKLNYPHHLLSKKVSDRLSSESLNNYDHFQFLTLFQSVADLGSADTQLIRFLIHGIIQNFDEFRRQRHKNVEDLDPMFDVSEMFLELFYQPETDCVIQIMECCNKLRVYNNQLTKLAIDEFRWNRKMLFIEQMNVALEFFAHQNVQDADLYSKMAYSYSKMLPTTRKYAKRRMPYMLNMITFFAKIRYWDDNFCGQFVESIIEYKEFLKIKQYAGFIQSCLKFDVDERSKNLLKQLIQDLGIYGSLELDARQLIRLVWCGAALNLQDVQFWELVIHQFQQVKLDNLPVVVYAQLQQAATLQNINNSSNSISFFENLPEAIQQKCLDAKIAYQKPRKSQIQKQVLRGLFRLEQRPILEWKTEDGEMNIDIILKRDDNAKVAVEVDGPTHFTVNKPYRYMFSTIYRNMSLASKGWHVISIPFYEWNEVENDINKQDQYLIKKLGDYFLREEYDKKQKQLQGIQPLKRIGSRRKVQRQESQPFYILQSVE